MAWFAGYSYQDFTYDNFSATNRDFMTDATNWFNLGSGLFLREGRADMGTYKNESKLIGFFGRVNYSLDDKYLITASLRYEGSSKFGIDNKWGAFPAISVGWRVSNEDFMQNAAFVNNLRVRLGYGEWLFYKEDGSVATPGDMTLDDRQYIGNGIFLYRS